MSVTQLKVIQRYHFRYQLKAHIPLVLVNNTNLHPILYCLQDVSRNWSNFSLL